MVRPGVHGNLVTSHVLGNEDLRVGDNTRADDEERRSQVFVVQVLEYFPVNTTSGRSQRALSFNSLRGCGRVFSATSTSENHSATYSREPDRHRN